MTSKGFTLFEVLLAAGIVALISGGIFMAVATGVRTSTTLVQHRLHSERLETLLALFRRVFINLPPSAELILETRERGSAELHLRHAPEAFSWTHKSAHVISLLSDGQKDSTLAIKSYSDSLTEPERQRTLREKTGWVQLFGGISRIQWRFFDLSSIAIGSSGILADHNS